MSGIAGVFHRDGQPVDAGALRRMTAAAPHRGPDGTTYLVDGPIGMAHQMLRTTPEASSERLPLVLSRCGGDGATRLTITFDGRLDNRDELVRRFLADGIRTRSATDGELTLRAYERWGEACPEHLVGDFAFVVWDAPARRLVCARDPLGIRPFYYSLSGATFLWASEIRQLLADPRVPRQPNEGMVGEYLAAVVKDVEQTLYRDIRRLAPGAVAIVAAGGVQTRRYWTGAPPRQLTYRNDAEYAEHFLSVFRESVIPRLRSDRPIGVWLSGGLDSSSVVGMAHDIGRRQTVPRLETFSLVFPDQPATDESRFIRDVVDRWGLSAHELVPHRPAAGDYWDQAARRLDVPDYPNDQLGTSVLRAMHRRGLRVALTGYGGDQGLTGSLYQYADLLRRGRLAAVVRQFRADRQMPDFQTTWRELATFGVGPLVPAWLKRRMRPVVGRIRHDVEVPSWIAPDFAARVDLRERLRPATLSRRGASFAAQDASGEFLSGSALLVAEMGERESAEHGLEDRHPFMDRRMVELMLALPDEQRRSGRVTKAVLRRAMHDLLPASVRTRYDKADFTHADLASLEALGGARFIDRLSIATHGWVDQRRASALYREAARLHASGDDGYQAYSGPLWMIAGIELWYRAVIAGEVAPAGAAIPRSA